MIVDGYWLKLMWAVLAGSWLLSAVIRAGLTYISWPEQRGRRVFAVLVHLLVAWFFAWRVQSSPEPPLHIPLPELSRNAVSLLLVIWVTLDGIWAVQGMAERRSLIISRRRDVPAVEEPCKTVT